MELSRGKFNACLVGRAPANNFSNLLLATSFLHVCVQSNQPGGFSASSKPAADSMHTSGAQNAPGHHALRMFGSTFVALLTVGLVVGLGYFVLGRRDKPTPATAQNMPVQRPASLIPYRLCRTGLPFSPLASRSGRRVLGSPCRLRHAPRSSPRARLRLQARRCLLSNNALTPIRRRAS